MFVISRGSHYQPAPLSLHSPRHNRLSRYRGDNQNTADRFICFKLYININLDWRHQTYDGALFPSIYDTWYKWIHSFFRRISWANNKLNLVFVFNQKKGNYIFLFQVFIVPLPHTAQCFLCDCPLFIQFRESPSWEFPHLSSHWR